MKSKMELFKKEKLIILNQVNEIFSEIEDLMCKRMIQKLLLLQKFDKRSKLRNLFERKYI